VLGQYGHLQEQEITAYAEPGDNVRQTTFEDGAVVTADFGRGELLVNGKPVVRPAALRDKSPDR